jgi:hypothetical protein
MLHDRFDRIEFPDPPAVNQTETELKTLLQRLIDQYGQIIAFRTVRSPESFFQIGRLYEHYAAAWNNQALPSLDADNLVVMKKTVHEKATRIFNQAQSAYGKAVEALKKVIQETAPGAGADSVIADAKLWLARSEDKLSETLYRMAEINSQSVYSLLTAPLPEGLSEVARLDYQSQLLTQVVLPVLDVILNSHRYNLRVADSLSINNQWTQASQIKILAALRLLGQQFTRLAFEALSGYGGKSTVYRQFAERRTDTPQDTIDAMMHCLDLVTAYGQNALDGYDDGIRRGAGYGIADSSLNAIQIEKKRFALTLTDTIFSNIKDALIDQQKTDSHFKTTQDPRSEEQLGVYEDQVFFLSKGYKAILEKALGTDSNRRSPESLLIRLKLVQIDPDLYASRFGLSRAQMVINTDSTWWCAASRQPDKSGWTHPAFGPAESHIAGVSRIRIQALPGIQGCAFRKDFSLPGWPVSGRLEFPDSPGRIVLNGVDWNGGSTAAGMQYFLGRGANRVALEQDGRFWAEGRIIIDYIPETAVIQ